MRRGYRGMSRVTQLLSSRARIQIQVTPLPGHKPLCCSDLAVPELEEHRGMSALKREVAWSSSTASSLGFFLHGSGASRVSDSLPSSGTREAKEPHPHLPTADTLARESPRVRLSCASCML